MLLFPVPPVSQCTHLAALREDGAREDRGRGGPVARDIVRLGGHLPHQRRAHVHEAAYARVMQAMSPCESRSLNDCKGRLLRQPNKERTP